MYIPAHTPDNEHILRLSAGFAMTDLAYSQDLLLVLKLFIGPSHLIFFLRQTSHARYGVSLTSNISSPDIAERMRLNSRFKMHADLPVSSSV